MRPNEPCKGCKSLGRCCAQGLVNRLAVSEWLEDKAFECPYYNEEEPKFYHGIEGVYS